MAKKRVLVTGGLGLLGTAVVTQLMKDDQYVIRIADKFGPMTHQHPMLQHQGKGLEILDVDLCDSSAARQAMEGINICLHLAAIAGGIANFHRRPSILLRNNIGALNSVFGAAIDERIDHIIYVSSSMVFERAEDFPLTEEKLAACPTPLSAYGFSKLAGEYYCRTTWEEFQIPYTILRPFNVYGPGEVPDREPGIAHVIPDLIYKIHSGQYPVQIFGSGTQTRCYTHIDDVTRSILIAMEHPKAINQDFIISSEHEISVADLAKLIWTMLGKDPANFALASVPSFKADVQRRWPTVEKARTLVGWQASVTLEQGLRDLIDWFRERGFAPPTQSAGIMTTSKEMQS